MHRSGELHRSVVHVDLNVFGVALRSSLERPFDLVLNYVGPDITAGSPRSCSHPTDTCQVPHGPLGGVALVPCTHLAFEVHPAVCHGRADLGVRDGHVPIQGVPYRLGDLRIGAPK